MNTLNTTQRISQLEQELRASEARFRNVITRNADAMMIIDTDGYVLYANPAAEHLFGRSLQQLVGSEFGFPMVVGETTDLDILRTQHGMWEVVIAEMRLTRTEWNGRPAFLADLRDITERRRAEQMLRQAEERYATIFHTETLAIAITTTHECRYLDVNDTFLRLTGYRREEVINQTVEGLGIWSHSDACRHLIDLLYNHQSTQGHTLSYRRKTGEIHVARVSLERIEINQQPCILSLFSDITEHYLYAQRQEALMQMLIELHATYPNDEFRTYLREHASKRFDPAVVEAFITLLRSYK